MKIWKIIKALLYLTAGVVLLVFHDVATNYAGYIVGGVVAAYAIESVVFSIIKKDYFGRHGLLFEGSVRLLLGVILIISSSDTEKVCVIWGVWGIVRESEEMTEALKRVVGKKPGIINIAESITVIVLSVGMIITPSFHHAHLHIIILGIELILEIVFASLEYLYDNRHEKSAVKDAVEKTLSQNNEDESRSA